MEVDNTIWPDTKRIVVVFSFEDDEQFDLYLDAFDKFRGENNLKAMSVICILPPEVKRETYQQVRKVKFISKKDFNFFGKMKNTDIEYELQQHFDLLAWFGDCTEKRVLSALMQLDCHWKIGFRTTHDFFNFQLSTQTETPYEMINFAKQILEKTSGHEQSI
jgi:hypothetical protein